MVKLFKEARSRIKTESSQTQRLRRKAVDFLKRKLGVKKTFHEVTLTRRYKDVYVRGSWRIDIVGIKDNILYLVEVENHYNLKHVRWLRDELRRYDFKNPLKNGMDICGMKKEVYVIVPGKKEEGIITEDDLDE